MTWPATAVATGDPVSAAQLNGLEILIASAELSEAGAFQFNDIPQHFRHLRVLSYLRGSYTDFAWDAAGFTFNGDIGAHYDVMVAQTGASNAGGLDQQTGWWYIPSGTAGGSFWGVADTKIVNYRDAGRRSVITVYSFTFASSAGGAHGGTSFSFWQGTDPITWLNLGAWNQPLEAQSRVHLYGIP